VGDTPPGQVTTPKGEDAYLEVGRSGSHKKDFSRATRAVGNVEVLLDACNTNLDPKDRAVNIERRDRPHLPRGTELLLRVLDREVDPETAEWMVGYARVTANMTHHEQDRDNPIQYVVASPLYVEHTTGPE